MIYIVPPGCMLARHFGDSPVSRFSRQSSGLAPDTSEADAVIQVYAARAARWRGAVGVHTWLALRRSDEPTYTRIEVMGYRGYWGGSAVRIWQRPPDNYWFGNRPVLLRQIVSADDEGNARVDALIDRIIATAQDYAYPDSYRVWPGPNSNTFTATVARAVPELRLELPPNAVGKDFLPNGQVFGTSPSGLGVQTSIAGLFGFIVGIEEGLEINLLGFTAGIDLYPPALKLPAIGRIGFPDYRSRTLGSS